MQVKEIMTKGPVCCTPSTSLQDAAKLMVDNDCGCIPVVENSSKNNPIGMITDRDITCRIVAVGQNPLDLTVRDAMTESAYTVSPETSLEDCCNLMENKQVRRVAVVDSNGSCCGIIAQADIAINAGNQKTAEVVQEVSRASA